LIFGHKLPDAGSDEPVIAHAMDTTNDAPARDGQSEEAFRFGVDLYDTVWNTQTDWHATLDLFEGIIHIARPEDGYEYAFGIRTMPRNKWVSLEAFGRRLPLDVRVTQEGVWARWLPPAEQPGS